MYYNPWQMTEVTRRNLPHWQQEGKLYFITFRLGDSIPTQKIRKWKAQREIWLQTHSEPLTEADSKEYETLFPEKLNDWLDAGMGECRLRTPANIGIVADALRFFDGTRYKLGDYVIMPNHVHLLLQPAQNESLPKILHSLKSYTSQEINNREDRKGSLWQSESYTRIVRSPEEHSHFQHYIANNPEKAGLQLPKKAILSTL